MTPFVALGEREREKGFLGPRVNTERLRSQNDNVSTSSYMALGIDLSIRFSSSRKTRADDDDGRSMC